VALAEAAEPMSSGPSGRHYGTDTTSGRRHAEQLGLEASGERPGGVPYAAGEAISGCSSRAARRPGRLAGNGERGAWFRDSEGNMLGSASRRGAARVGWYREILAGFGY
jgi:hypothetical protein